MALRSGYKGFKKLLPGLKLFRPGTLGIDNDVLIPELNKTFFPRSEQAVLGAKNLLKNSAITKTENGITATVNSNGIITLNGTSTGEFTMWIGPISVMSGKTYTISSGVDNDSITTQRLWCESSNAFPVGNRLSTDGNVNKTRTALANETFNVKLQIFAGQTYNNVIVYPMISLDGGEYVPYAMTNRELTEKVQGIINAATNAADFAAFKTAIGNL